MDMEDMSNGADSRRNSTTELFIRKPDNKKLFLIVGVVVLIGLVLLAIIISAVAISNQNKVPAGVPGGPPVTDGGSGNQGGNNGGNNGGNTGGTPGGTPGGVVPSGHPDANVNLTISAARPLFMDAGASSLDAVKFTRRAFYKQVWTLQRGHDYGAHEYFDKQGYLQGFTNDIVKAVCDAAGIQCRLVWDRYENCWNSLAGQHSYGGKGMFGGNYDACMGWYTTLDRIHVFDFSQAYMKAPNAYFYVKKGNPGNMNANVQKKIIGFLDGWASDEKCLARQQSVVGSFLPPNYVKHYIDPKALKKAILDDEIDAGFATYESMEQFIGNDGDLQQLNIPFQCMIDGNALMTRKGSLFVSLWNSGFSKIRSNGQFRKICEKGKETHGVYGSIDCVDS